MLFMTILTVCQKSILDCHPANHASKGRRLLHHLYWLPCETGSTDSVEGLLTNMSYSSFLENCLLKELQRLA